ncbi:alpha-E domain-containing protein [Abyssibius alkaniclasticus]|uniref:alpha-E domain-containing protein n=1 Tax=Abyssibius alkaniclasticus TaxID=2881234 RepID=UPI0040582202
MLSRTAESLYWAARYMERTDATARLLEVGYRMAMMPTAAGGHANEWESVLAAAGAAQGFADQFDAATKSDTAEFLIFDEANPSSIRNCLRAARNNLRAARTAVTSEVWEAVNESYLHLLELEAQRALSLPELCDWTKRQSAVLRGAFSTTQLRSDGYDFFNLGYYVERADNTARLLDVKYYVLLPTIDMVGGEIDRFQWLTLLRALSAHRAFHWAYGGDISPEQVAHFLILNPSSPRSLLFCAEQIDRHLKHLSLANGGRTPADDFAADMFEALGTARIDAIMAQGVHDFLTGCIERNAKLHRLIGESYLFGAM